MYTYNTTQNLMTSVGAVVAGVEPHHLDVISNQNLEGGEERGWVDEARLQPPLSLARSADGLCYSREPRQEHWWLVNSRSRVWIPFIYLRQIIYILEMHFLTPDLVGTGFLNYTEPLVLLQWYSHFVLGISMVKRNSRTLRNGMTTRSPPLLPLFYL